MSEPWFARNVLTKSIWPVRGSRTTLAHASIDGRRLAANALGPELPFLREREQSRSFSRDFQIDLGLPEDADVYALYVGRLASRLPCTLTLVLTGESGDEVLRRTIAIRAGGATILEPLEGPVRALNASLRLDAASEDRVTISDVRLVGQSRTLRQYLRRTLRFPPP